MEDVLELRIQKRKSAFARNGLLLGLMAGATWGLDLVLMGIATGPAYIGGSSGLLTVAVLGACIHNGFSSIWLLLWLLRSGKYRELARSIKTHAFPYLLLAALLGGPIAMTCSVLGIRLSGAPYSAAVSAVYPVLGAILGILFLKERMTSPIWKGLLLTAAGTAIVCLSQPAGGEAAGSLPYFQLGLLVSFLAAVGWAIEGVGAAFCTDVLDTEVTAALHQASSFLMYLILWFALEGSDGMEMLLHTVWSPAGLLLCAAGLTGGISFVTWFYSMNRAGVAKAASLNSTYGLWAVLWGWLMGQSGLTLHLAAGALIAAAGTALTLLGPPRQARRSTKKKGIRA
jgi:drug/metabolite transporter (DMT)-like permease